MTAEERARVDELLAASPISITLNPNEKVVLLRALDLALALAEFGCASAHDRRTADAIRKQLEASR